MAKKDVQDMSDDAFEDELETLDPNIAMANRDFRIREIHQEQGRRLHDAELEKTQQNS